MGMIAGAALIWGTIGVAVSLLYRLAPADPLGVGFLRLLISAPTLLIMGWVIVGSGFLRVRRGDLGTMALMGVAFATYQVCYFAAIPRLGVAAAVMINICSVPILTALLSRVFLGERLSRIALLAMGGAVLGTAMLVGGAPESRDLANTLTGATLALGAGLSYSIVTMTSRAVAPYYHPLQPIAFAFSLGALLLAPMALTSGLHLAYPAAGWGLLLYLGLVPTAAAYVLYLRGMSSTPATVAATLTLLEPLGSTLLAVLFLGEHLAPLALLGAGLLLASMGMLYRGR
ncbi:EamA family transporter [Chloroflexales bacterium ZM16-3]|nr:EamA family transporter [Chloroflexales bacterium ZM16-3]